MIVFKLLASILALALFALPFCVIADNEKWGRVVVYTIALVAPAMLVVAVWLVAP